MNQGVFESLIENKSQQKRMMWLILAAFSLETIIRYVVIFITKLPVVSAFSGAFKPVLYICLIFMNYESWIRKRVKVTDILFVWFFFFVVLVSYFVFPDTREFVEQQKNILFLVFPLYYLMGVVFTTDKDTMETLGFLAKVIILVDILFAVYWTSSGNELGTDAMARAYAILPSVLFLIMCAFNRSKTWDWIWMIFASIYIFTCGTRGPIIVIAVYLLYCLLVKRRNTMSKKILYTTFVAGFVIFYNSPAFEIAIQGLMDLFKQLGVSTRIFEHMLGDTMISDMSGREDIYAKIFQLISENPLGYGVLGEYPFLGWNTHNLYLQFFMHYGIVFGGLMIFFSLFLVIKAFKNNPNVYARDFVAMWFCITFARSFAGGSYLTYYFAFMLGLAVNELRNKKYLYKTMSKKKEVL